MPLLCSQFSIDVLPSHCALPEFPPSKPLCHPHAQLPGHLISWDRTNTGNGIICPLFCVAYASLFLCYSFLFHCVTLMDSWFILSLVLGWKVRPPVFCPAIHCLWASVCVCTYLMRVLLPYTSVSAQLQFYATTLQRTRSLLFFSFKFTHLFNGLYYISSYVIPFWASSVLCQIAVFKNKSEHLTFLLSIRPLTYAVLP